MADEICGYSHLAHANDLDPAPGHAYLREHCPLHHESGHELGHESGFYVVSRHADVMEVLTRPEMWRNGDGPGVFVQRGGVLGSADNPDHLRQRRVLQPAFMPRLISQLEPQVHALCDDLLDGVLPLGTGDVVELFAFPFPALVIGELLGVHPEDREDFKTWSAAVTAALGGGDLVAYEAATHAIWAYIDRLVDERWLALDAAGWQPGDPDPLGSVIDDDVVSRLAVAERNGDLQHREVQRLGHQLLVAGHETTAGLISLMLRHLALRPDLSERLRSDPSLIEVAVEEALRFESPVQGLFRTNATECELRGQTIGSGTKLQVLFASANRDPARWTDPDEFLLDRDPDELRRHVAFGFGVHFCIGAPVARLEAKVAIERFLARTTSFEMSGPPPQPTEPFILRGLSQLHLRWEARSASGSAGKDEVRP